MCVNFQIIKDNGYAANCIGFALGGTQTQENRCFKCMIKNKSVRSSDLLFSVLWVYEQVKLYLYSRNVFSNKVGPDPKCLLGARNFGATW